MRSSAEEFLLVLKKWKSESAIVRLNAIFSSELMDAAVLVEGELLLDEPDIGFAIRSNNGSLFMIRSFSSEFHYSRGAGISMTTPGLFKASPNELEEALFFGDKGQNIVIARVKPLSN